MAKLVKQVQEIENQKMSELSEEQITQIRRLTFILENGTLTTNESTQSAETSAWHLNMAHVFSQHRSIIENKKDQFQNGLKVLNICKVRFKPGLLFQLSPQVLRQFRT